MTYSTKPLNPPQVESDYLMAAEPGSQILSHLPMLFLMGLAIWYLRSAASSASAPPDATMQELCEQQVAEMRRMNAMLEGMAVVETRP